jgi:hypothetical protein
MSPRFGAPGPQIVDRNRRDRERRAWNDWWYQNIRLSQTEAVIQISAAHTEIILHAAQAAEIINSDQKEIIKNEHNDVDISDCLERFTSESVIFAIDDVGLSKKAEFKKIKKLLEFVGTGGQGKWNDFKNVVAYLELSSSQSLNLLKKPISRSRRGLSEQEVSEWLQPLASQYIDRNFSDSNWAGWWNNRFQGDTYKSANTLRYHYGTIVRQAQEKRIINSRHEARLINSRLDNFKKTLRLLDLIERCGREDWDKFEEIIEGLQISVKRSLLKRYEYPESPQPDAAPELSDLDPVAGPSSPPWDWRPAAPYSEFVDSPSRSMTMSAPPPPSSQMSRYGPQPGFATPLPAYEALSPPPTGYGRYDSGYIPDGYRRR